MEEEKKWYVVYTRPRWEKKVHALFDEKGFLNYCPLNKVRKKWSDRMKTVYEPLFKSYVFIKIGEEEKTEVRMVNGVVNFVYWLGKPAVVRENEIVLIKKFLNEHENVQAEPLPIVENMKVRVEGGALMGKDATVVKVMNNKVQIIIDSIGYSLTAYVDKSNLAVS
ncbi:MAG: UpxY family transcription antiterminator [Bacteroidetes bacterium]|nr:UpxY family transcription antiterminator [Bacteroidota bacterium]MBS1947281.1 UpxY family transcription antiterminator [Bacteroidota bacterium]MBS1973361.1 UpxY family transcription antiterminator [Bacteroidota bacterium]